MVGTIIGGWDTQPLLAVEKKKVKLFALAFCGDAKIWVKVLVPKSHLLKLSRPFYVMVKREYRATMAEENLIAC